MVGCAFCRRDCVVLVSSNFFEAFQVAFAFGAKNSNCADAALASDKTATIATQRLSDTVREMDMSFSCVCDEGSGQNLIRENRTGRTVFACGTVGDGATCFLQKGCGNR